MFAFHGYPWLIHRLTYRRRNHRNLHVRGYKEEGTTTTPFDMVVRNDLDRFHLVDDVIDRVAGARRIRPRTSNRRLRQARRAQALRPDARRRHARDPRLEVDSIAARVVCISRETGADGETVGRVVADRLGLQYVDEEVIARAAERGGVDEGQLADAEQRKSRIRRVIELLTDAGTAAGAPGAEPASIRAAREEEQRALIRAVIDEIAAEGNAVIVAHAASMALAGAEGILRVLVTASPEERVKRLVETEKIANADAARLIMESDQARADYFRHFYGVGQELPTHYDLVVNTDVLGAEQAAEIVVHAAQLS